MALLRRALFWPSKVYISSTNTNYNYIIFASMGDWTPVPWRREDRKQMLYPLDHDAPQVQNLTIFKISMITSDISEFPKNCQYTTNSQLKNLNGTTNPHPHPKKWFMIYTIWHEKPSYDKEVVKIKMTDSKVKPHHSIIIPTPEGKLKENVF